MFDKLEKNWLTAGCKVQNARCMSQNIKDDLQCLKTILLKNRRQVDVQLFVELLGTCLRSPIGGQRPTKVLRDYGRVILLLDHPKKVGASQIFSNAPSA